MAVTPGRRMRGNTMPKPAAQVLLERYWEEVNNQGRLELIRELCSDLSSLVP